MVFSDLFNALLTLALLALFSTGRVENWHIYIVLFFRAIAGTCQSLSMQSSISLLVPKGQLIRVAGLRQTLDAGMSIGAPLLGALLVGLLSMENIILIDTATCLLAVIPLLFISIPKHLQEGCAIPSVWLGMKLGFAYIRGWRGLLILCFMAGLLNLFVGSVSTLLPIMVTRHYGAAVGTLAIFESMFCVGMLVGGLVISIWGGFQKRINTMLFGIVGLGIAISAFGLSTGLPTYMACASVFFAGFMIVISNTPILALLQLMVPTEMQGRVFATVGSLSAASVPLGLVIAGPLADVFEVSPIYISIGCICSIIGIAASRIPALTKIEQQKQG
jgi:DHA3 family macrolide efflux protein-like MFS transporter